LLSKQQSQAMRNSDRGIIFNIQGYCIHDGPGIRTSVFLKGCPLCCSWCQNPESHFPLPELFFAEEKCTGCGTCIPICPEKAIRLQGIKSYTDRQLCKGAGLCVDACPNEARAVIGRRATADEVFKEIAADSLFYRESGGGVTLSGGEPLAQPEFAASILRKCRDAGFHTALDTCGYASWTAAREVLHYVNLVLFDFKHMNPEIHRRYTGVSNELILQNAENIHHEMSIPMWARVTLVPGFNDSVENIEATARFIADRLSSAIPVHLLPYHRLGEAKWEKLGGKNEFASIEIPGERQLVECRRIFESFGLTAIMGG
jgi:pyruvate formate lyase activating enzyme